MSRCAHSAVIACILAILTAGPASAKPGQADFTPSNTAHRYSGDHGVFTADAVYDPANPRLFWSLRLSDSVRAIVQGPMSCGAHVEGKRGYADHHPSIAADYQWHSVVPNLQLDTRYRLVANCAFTATNGHTTAPGRVDYSVVFTLHSR
ncbi:hypothetical protein [Nocardia harenae]|uniref:hypothetical protein n=1 Tax=Nocardia harenae TaxID=358707 RepID=UPI00082F6DB4|nr:hypothetical protein [Nocardia harenae]